MIDKIHTSVPSQKIVVIPKFCTIAYISATINYFGEKKCLHCCKKGPFSLAKSLTCIVKSMCQLMANDEAYGSKFEVTVDDVKRMVSQKLLEQLSCKCRMYKVNLSLY